MPGSSSTLPSPSSSAAPASLPGRRARSSRWNRSAIRPSRHWAGSAAQTRRAGRAADAQRDARRGGATARSSAAASRPISPSTTSGAGPLRVAQAEHEVDLPAGLLEGRAGRGTPRRGERDRGDQRADRDQQREVRRGDDQRSRVASSSATTGTANDATRSAGDVRYGVARPSSHGAVHVAAVEEPVAEARSTSAADVVDEVGGDRLGDRQDRQAVPAADGVRDEPPELARGS